MATCLMLFIIAVDLEKFHRLSAKFKVVQDRNFLWRCLWRRRYS